MEKTMMILVNFKHFIIQMFAQLKWAF